MTTLPKTNSLPLKMDGWKMKFPFGKINMDGWKPIFRGKLAVRFREGTINWLLDGISLVKTTTIGKKKRCTGTGLQV